MRSISSPVYVVQLVHRVDCQNHFCQVKLSHILRQAVLELAEQSQQIPTHIVVHHQVLQRGQRKEKHTDETLNRQRMHQRVKHIFG